MNPKAINALREFFETNYNSVGARFLRIDVSLRFRVDFPFAGPFLDIHTSRDDVYDEVHNPSGCRASIFFSFLTLTLFLVSYRVCIPDSRTRKIGPRQRHSSRYEFMAHYTQTRHESPLCFRTKISASTTKPWRRHWMASAPKLRLSRCVGSVVCIRFLHSDSCYESVQRRMLSPGWRNGSPSGN
jgi:hypothetical protein